RRAHERAPLGGERGDRRRGGGGPLRRLAVVAARRRADARRSRGADRGAAPRLQRRALVLARDERPQPGPRGRPGVAAPGPDRRRDQLPDPARLGPPPFPLGPRAGGARTGALEPGAARMNGDGWPGGARGALSLSFDNLGEAAEIGAGAVAPEAPGVGSHPTATTVLPGLLDRLGTRGLRATFFVEGLNAKLYPDLLREIDARGHEVAYHA